MKVLIAFLLLLSTASAEELPTLRVPDPPPFCASPASIVARASRTNGFHRSRSLTPEIMKDGRIQGFIPDEDWLGVFPAYNTGLLIEESDLTAIFLYGFEGVLCRGTDLDEKALVQFRLVLSQIDRVNPKPRIKPRRTRTRAKPYVKTHHPEPIIERGVASFYWPTKDRFGHSIAAGGYYDPEAMTAAHKSLRFGTIVRVTDEETARTVVVTINDRGPYIEGRIIDLSPAAARRLGLSEEKGITAVTIETLPATAQIEE